METTSLPEKELGRELPACAGIVAGAGSDADPPPDLREQMLECYARISAQVRAAKTSGQEAVHKLSSEEWVAQ